MKNCLHCNCVIDPVEIYEDWFHCLGCNKDFPYQPERLSEKDQKDKALDELVKQSQELGLYDMR